jgi:hypothetical protein
MINPIVFLPLTEDPLAFRNPDYAVHHFAGEHIPAGTFIKVFAKEKFVCFHSNLSVIKVQGGRSHSFTHLYDIL